MARLRLIFFLLFVTVVLLSQAAFVVDEKEQVVVTEWGKPIDSAIATPGIHFKTPFIQTAHYFDKRFLEWNGAATEMPTRDKRFLMVDMYARWRITDPLKFYQRVQNEAGAQSRLDDIIDGETRSAVAQHEVLEIVRSTNREVQVDPALAEEEQTRLEPIKSGRVAIMADILRGSQERAKDLGVEILDVRFMRINYNEDVQKSVYQRMIAERNRIAERFVSEGEGESARIRGEKERRLKEIESEAYRKSQEIVGRADAEATAIYAEAYNSDKEFYAFLKSMEAYPGTLDNSTTLVLSSEGDFLKYLDGPDP